MQFYLHDTAQPSISHFVNALSLLLPADTAWHHILGSAECNRAPISLYFNYVAASDDGQTLIGSVWGDKLYKSSNYGATWAAIAATSTQFWFGCSCSSDAQVLIAGNQNGLVTYSLNGGTSASNSVTIGTGACNAVSADGQKFISGPGTGHFESGFLFISNNQGSSWSQVTSAGSRAWVDIKFAKNNSNIIVAAAYNDYIYISADGGTNWTAQTAAGQRKWQRIALSDDGQTIYASTLETSPWKSSNGGSSWAALSALDNSNWSGVDCSADGAIVLIGAATDGDAQAISSNGRVYKSTNGGTSFALVAGLGNGAWNCVTVSADGQKMTALSNAQGLWYSTDGGATWTRTIANTPGKGIKLILDGNDITDFVSDVWPSLIPAMNGLEFFVGINTGDSTYNGDMADLWVAPGVSLLDASGDIPVPVRHQFRAANGSPCDPLNFPPGAVLLSGPASEFPINKAAGGSFNVTGSLTDAATHP